MVQSDRRIAGVDADMSWRVRLGVPSGLLELIVAAPFAFLALWLWIGSYSFAEGEGGLSGAVAFPRGVSLVLGSACLVLAYQGVASVVAERSNGRACRFPPARRRAGDRCFDYSLPASALAYSAFMQPTACGC